MHIPALVQQHVEEAANLRGVRSALVRSPQLRLADLAKLDERIAAHLDGIAVAGDCGIQMCMQALDPPTAGPVFVVTTRAIERHDGEQLRQMLALGEALPACQPAVLSAFGWVSPGSLRGITRPLLEAQQPWWRQVGLAACALHRVDPGTALEMACAAADPGLKLRALATAAALGRVDLCAHALAAAQSDDARLAFHGARTGVLLGDRSSCFQIVQRLAAAPGAWRESALQLTLKLTSTQHSRSLLKSLHGDAARVRTLIRAIGVAGDVHFVPWLIARMHDERLARLAGEAFCLISGADLSRLDLDRKIAAADVATLDDGGADAEDAARSEILCDEQLPWPNAAKVGAWWQTHGAKFSVGLRYFMGQPVSATPCIDVLREGNQRQRRHAAEHLCLLQPGTPLFNIAAPAWRQKRALAQAPAR